MERSYIPLNFPNTVSIVLMATVGFILLGAVSATIQNYRGS